MWNRTFILLYSNAPNFPAQSGTPQYQSNNQNFVSGITCAILTNGTFVLLYSKFQITLPEVIHLYVIQTAIILYPEPRKAKGLWKKLRESEQIVAICQNNPSNNEKLDSYSIYCQSNNLHEVKHFNNSQTTNISSLELENTGRLWEILIEPKKNTKKLEQVLQYWEMTLSFCYIPMSQITLPRLFYTLILIKQPLLCLWNSERLKNFERN